jgi:hypothetical protein
VVIEKRKANLRIGTEYRVLRNVYLRAGVDGLNTSNGLTCGFGMKIKKIKIDYSLTSYDPLGPTHKLSLSIK